MKAEHKELVDKKSTLKTALIAARGTMTKFGQIASFWEEFVLEPEEKELQQQRTKRRQQHEQGRRWNATKKTTTNVPKAKSCDELVVGKAAAKAAFTGSKQSSSQDDSSLSSCLLLQSLLHRHISAQTATTSDQRGSDRRDRCASDGDRDCCFVGGKDMMPMPKPKPEPAEINIDLERILPPVEYCAVAAAAETAMV